MGAWYGSVQVRTVDRQRAKQAAEKVARARAITCLVGPEIAGWVGIYPQDSGQDQTVGEQIAAELSGDVLQLVVSDDDVTAYWLWRDGRLIDSYWSTPGYFGEEHRADQEQLVGRPEVFGLSDGKTGALRRVLGRNHSEYTFEHERLVEFAAMLGISNCTTSYEYLKGGETDGIKGFRQFEEVPADEVAKERSNLAARKKELKKTGRLLAAKTKKYALPRICRAGDGIFAAWAGTPIAEAMIELWRPPWRKPEAMSTEECHAVASDASGERVAMAMRGHIAVRSTRDWSLLMEVAGSECAVAMSPDGKTIAHSSRGQLVVDSVETGQRVASVPAFMPGRLAFHPSGQFVAAVESANAILLVPVSGGAGVRRLYPGGMEPLPPPREPSPEEHETEERRMREFARKMAGEAPRPGVPYEEAVAQIETQLLAQRTYPAPPARSCESVSRIGWTQDGSVFWYGTGAGLCVCDWDVLSRGEGDMAIEPRLRAFFPPAELDFLCDSVGAATNEPSGEGILFGTATGRLCRADPMTGAGKELITIPGDVHIVDMCFTSGGENLAVVAKPDFRYHSERQNGGIIQIWSYGALQRHAGNQE